MIPILYFHLGTLAITACVILYTDHQAFRYLTGKKQTLDKKLMTRLHYLVWAGLLGMIGTGLLMAWPSFGALLSVPGFALKMAFVALLFINAIFIGFLLPIASEKPFAELSLRTKIVLIASGGVSTIGWVGGTLAAMFTFGNIFRWIHALF